MYALKVEIPTSSFGPPQGFCHQLHDADKLFER